MPASPAVDWDRHVNTYAELFAPLTGHIARGMLALVAGRLPADARVLDIACGTGAFTLPLVAQALAQRQRGSAGALVTACDFSEGMVEHTRGAGDRLGADEQVLRCEVQNGEALSYPDASFDAVASSFGIFLFADRLAGWREAARVLRPGGIFVTSVWQGPETNMMLRAQAQPVLEALPEHLRPTSPRSWMEIAREDALIAEVCDAAPLVDARCYPYGGSIVLPSPRACFEAMVDNPVVGALLRSCDAEQFDAVRRSVISSFVERSGGEDQPFVLDATCNILVATRAG